MKEKLFALFWVLFLALPLMRKWIKPVTFTVKGQVAGFTDK